MKVFSIDSRELPKPHGAIAQATLDHDEDWFRVNPGFKTRIRMYRTGEFGPDFRFLPRTRILVVRLEPFIFAKFPLPDQEGGRR